MIDNLINSALGDENLLKKVDNPNCPREPCFIIFSYKSVSGFDFDGIKEHKKMLLVDGDFIQNILSSYLVESTKSYIKKIIRETEFREDKKNLNQRHFIYEKGFGFGSLAGNLARGIKEEIENEYGIGEPDVNENVYYFYASNFRDYDEGHKSKMIV